MELAKSTGRPTPLLSLSLIGQWHIWSRIPQTLVTCLLPGSLLRAEERLENMPGRGPSSHEVAPLMGKGGRDRPPLYGQMS